MNDHKIEAPRAIKVTGPFRFIEIDMYLEKPASFLGIYKNLALIRGVTSCLYVSNIGPLHLSFEIFKKHRGDPLGESKNEIDDETASGDGCIHRRTL